MKISRRTMLAGSAAAIAVPLIGGAERRRADAATSRTSTRLAAADTAAAMTFALRNNTGADTVYAFVTGQALDNGNALTLLTSDGRTPYYPASPAAPGSPLGADCAIPLGPSGGAPVTVTVPHLAGARLWFS